MKKIISGILKDFRTITITVISMIIGGIWYIDGTPTITLEIEKLDTPHGTSAYLLTSEGLHADSVLNFEQFEIILLPSYQKVIEAIVEYDGLEKKHKLEIFSGFAGAGLQPAPFFFSYAISNLSGI